MKVTFETQKPKLLDLFCGGGGAAKGYADAGFEVVGIDIVDRPNYPYQFIQMDALTALMDEQLIVQFDFIHASPPCQRYSRLKYLSGNVEEWEDNHVDLIPPVRERLKYISDNYGIGYVIENVVGAPLINPIKLCGSQFPNMLTQRPRLFESNIKLKEPPVAVHSMETGRLGEISPNGTVSVCGEQNLRGYNEVQTKLYYGFALGGIDWMSLKELTQCIPPSYTEWIGHQLIDSMNVNVEDEQEPSEFPFNIEEFVSLVKKYLAS